MGWPASHPNFFFFWDNVVASISCKFRPTARPNQPNQLNQPNNKQNQINLATSNQKNFYGHFRSGRFVTVEGGHRQSRRSCGGWASSESQIVGIVVVGGRSAATPEPSRATTGGGVRPPQSVREPPCGGAPPQREERWPRAAPYGSEVAAVGGFSSLF
jgi:hypothetical protein